MGHGGYDQKTRTLRASALGYDTKSAREIFSHEIDRDMHSLNVKLRESRDSEEHPLSVAIIIALDVTGSMGHIPHDLVKKGLPAMIDNIIKAGIAHPQVLFLAVGDHFKDHYPLQIGQFESSDELLDKWLTKIYLEGGGGGNGGESYSLAHYFAAYHTAIDCFEKRGQKGFLITIGDEANHKNYAGRSIQGIMGAGEYPDNYTSAELVAKAKEKYHVFHLEMNRGHHDDYNTKSWQPLVGERLIEVADHENIPQVIADLISQNVSPATGISSVVTTEKENSFTQGSGIVNDPIVISPNNPFLKK
jgi:hypothetical protein